MSQTQPIIEVELPSGDTIAVVRRRFGGARPGPRVVFVAGIRGDAPEGIRIVHRIASVLEEHEANISGTVDLYPCANPLAAHRGARLWPFFDVDLNRLFPGREDGHPPHRVAHALMEDTRGADQVVELRGARAEFSEALQAHVRLRDGQAAERALACNVSVVWARRPGPAAPSTFAHQFHDTIVLEGGTGNRLTPGVGRDLGDGALNLLATLGILPEDALPFHWAGLRRPTVLTDDRIHRIRSDRGGLFLPNGEVWSKVEEGGELGIVVDPVTGDERARILSPIRGRLLAIRELPVVFPGSMVARVVDLPDDA